jgi:annexin A7/11
MGHQPQHSGQFGAPPGPPPGQYGQGPPPGQFGAPPPGQYAPPQAYQQAPTGPPAPPSLGYAPGQMSNVNMSGAADAMRKAMKGFGTDEKTLIQVLAPMGPLEVASVKHAFQQGHKRDLLKDVHSETSSYFREGLEAIIRGPLEQDCFTLREALSGMGTKEAMLDEVLLGRTNADINAIKRHYQHMYKRSLESDLKSDLSGKTERMYDMVVAARRTEESAPINPQQIDQNVNDLYKATEGQMGTDELQVCAIICMLTLLRLTVTMATDQTHQHRLPPPSSVPLLKHINAGTNALSPSASAKSSRVTCKMLFFTWSTAPQILQR